MAKVSEIIVRSNGHPVFSGSRFGALNAVQAAIQKALAEGRPEPDIKTTLRVVDYDLADSDANKVTETEISL